MTAQAATPRLPMNISQAAQKTGLTSKTIRYYESIGLIQPASRQANGYRNYSELHLRELRFVAHARDMGFTLEECRELLGLYRDKSRRSADVKALTREKIDDINHKIRALETMRDSLMNLSDCCHGDERPDCPILDNLASPDQ